MDLKDQHRHHDHPHLHLSHPYLHSQVDQVGSGKDFKDAESSKLQERQETCLPPELCLWLWVPGPLFMFLIINDVCSDKNMASLVVLVVEIFVFLQVHHAAYCLTTAVATKRTLIFSSKHWKYSK